MPEIPTPNQVGFAEFVTQLISEVFEAIGASQFDQEQRLAELVAATGLPLEEFADRFVTDDQVTAELVRLLPGPSADHPTAIYVGAPYRAPRDAVKEHPPIFTALGVRLERGDYSVKQRKTLLTASGVDKVRAAVRQQLATRQHTAMEEIVRRGLPRVTADGGRINAKVTYQVKTAEEAEAGERLVAPLQPLGSVVSLTQPAALSGLRLAVRPADERAPQTQELRVDVFGEVEISFKTIT